MTQYSIGVDLGGTNYRAAAIDGSGKLLEKVSGTTNPMGGREAIVGEIVSAISRLRAARAGDELAGIGVALPGFIVMETGVIVSSPNIPPFENFPARDTFQDRLKTPVILENDANAAALGEKWMGAGRDVNDLVLLTLGTGIGGGIISDGKVLHGYLGMAAELGHVTVDPTGTPCACGNTGCLEKHASATAISTNGAAPQPGRQLDVRGCLQAGHRRQRASQAHLRVHGARARDRPGRVTSRSSTSRCTS